MKEGWDAGLRGRLGYLVTPWIMVFGTGGVAWQRVEATMRIAAPREPAASTASRRSLLPIRRC